MLQPTSDQGLAEAALGCIDVVRGVFRLNTEMSWPDPPSQWVARWAFLGLRCDLGVI